MVKKSFAIQIYDQMQRTRKAIFNVLVREYPEIMKALNHDQYVEGMTYGTVFTIIEATERYFVKTMHEDSEITEQTLFKESLRGQNINSAYLARLRAEHRAGTLDIEDLLK